MYFIKKFENSDCCFILKTNRREKRRLTVSAFFAQINLYESYLRQGLNMSRPTCMISTDTEVLGFLSELFQVGKVKNFTKSLFSQKQTLFIPIQNATFSTSRPLSTPQFRLSLVDNKFLVALSVKARSLSKPSRSSSCFQNGTFEKFNIFVGFLQISSHMRKKASRTL